MSATPSRHSWPPRSPGECRNGDRCLVCDTSLDEAKRGPTSCIGTAPASAATNDPFAMPTLASALRPPYSPPSDALCQGGCGTRPGPGGILCAACKAEIELRVYPWTNQDAGRA